MPNVFVRYISVQFVAGTHSFLPNKFSNHFSENGEWKMVMVIVSGGATFVVGEKTQYEINSE